MSSFLQAELPLEEQLELLTDLGLEVEGNIPFESIKGSLEGVVVGEVISCEQHPNADRLRVTQVNLGGEEPVQIVCGAPNVAAQQKVAVATVGTTLYDGDGNPWQIKKSKIRGEVSMGMICAEDELGLGESHDGIIVLDSTLEPGTPCRELFAVEKDTTIEIGLTPNRADAMSHFGVARDLKAGCIQRGISFTWKTPNTNGFKIDNTSRPIDVVVEASELCPQYSGLTISNIEVKPSPTWLQNKLKAIGLSPINNIVDITNFVLHELGQPLHAFDADQITGKIIVKQLPNQTEFTTLDGVERKLHADDLMICDEEKPLCIAGVFGGKDAGVSASTKNIFLESAYFDAVSIRKTAKRHGLNTDASFRYERGIDPEMREFALKRAAELIKEIAGGEITSEIVNITQPLQEKASLFLKFKQISSTIGQDIHKDELITILNALEIEIINVTEEGFSMKIPRYRVDVTRPADVIEEILRIYGYNKIKSDNQMKTFYPDFSLKTPLKFEQKIANQLVGMGFHEVINNSITTPAYSKLSEQLSQVEGVNLLNPLGKELSEMRKSLVFSLLEVVAFNNNRQQRDLKLYEFGKVYAKKQGGFAENKKLGLILTGKLSPERWNSENKTADFFHLKGITEALLSQFGAGNTMITEGKSDLFSTSIAYGIGEVTLVEFGNLNASILKNFGIDQPVFYAEFDFDSLYNNTFIKEVKVEPIPKFPSSRRDFALLLDKEIAFEDLQQKARSIEKKILKKVDLFDVYEGKNLPEGKKSYGVSFLFSDENKTLTDKHIDKVMQKLKKAFEQEFNAQLR